MKRSSTVVAILLAAACGSSAPAPKEPTTRATADEGEPEAKASKPSRGAHCADGSCFSCGDAVCLSGYFCAIGKAGHGCAWTASCASSPSCACLGPTIKANATCRCEEKNGGVYVICDGASL